MKSLAVSSLALILSLSASAQITLTQANIPGIGTTFTSYYTQDEQSYDAGAGGASQNWDISAFDYTIAGVSTYVSPASTPFAADFPTATHAAESDFSWSYFRSAANGFFSLGYAFQDSASANPNDEEYLLLPFPCTMNTSWTAVMRFEYEIFPGFVITTVDSELHHIDGWGNLTIPTPVAETFAALRDQSHSYEYSLLNGEPQGDAAEFWSYDWYGQNGVQGGSYTSPISGTGPNFTSGYLSFSVQGGSAIDPIRGPVARGFEVEQNYPNPFNPNTTLPVELSHAAKVSVTIYNEVGQAVLQFEESLGAGRHELPIDGSSWSSGSYFAKVTADQEVQTTKMVLVK